MGCWLISGYRFPFGFLYICSNSPKPRFTLTLFSFKKFKFGSYQHDLILKVRLICILVEHYVSERSTLSICGVEESVHFNKMHAFKFHDILASNVTALTVSKLSDHLGFSHHILVLKFITICGLHQIIKTLLKKILMKLIGIVSYGSLRRPRWLFVSRNRKWCMAV